MSTEFLSAKFGPLWHPHYSHVGLLVQGMQHQYLTPNPTGSRGGKHLEFYRMDFRHEKLPDFEDYRSRKFRSKKVGCQQVAFVKLMCLLVGKNGCFAQTWIMHQKKGKTRFFHPTRMKHCNSNNKISSVSVGVEMSPREPAIFFVCSHRKHLRGNKNESLIQISWCTIESDVSLCQCIDWKRSTIEGST